MNLSAAEQKECIRAWLVRHADRLRSERPGLEGMVRQASAELGVVASYHHLRILAAHLDIRYQNIATDPPTQPLPRPHGERLKALEQQVAALAKQNEALGIGLRALMRVNLGAEG